MTQTVFDQALENARAPHDNPDLENQSWFELYQVFFDTIFYLPVAEEADLTQEDAELSPLIVMEEGEEVIFFFDTEERLKEWAGEEKMFIAPMTGEDLLLTFGPERMMVCNPHLEQVKEFSTEEIEFLFNTFFQEDEDE
jgi:hypothetical protein